MDKTTDLPRPPRTVLLAVVLISFGFGLGFITWTITAHWEKPIVPVVCLLFLLVMLFYVRSIYSGHNWARWIFTILTVMGLFGSGRAISHFHSQIEIAGYAFQC